jgi:tetratricopeptide (TPR) repeat protein
MALVGAAALVAGAATARAAEFALDDGARTLARALASPRTCATCHADIAAQWSSSAHHFASFNNPYYVASVEDFRRERGKRASRFCAQCHDPLLVADGSIDGDIDPTRAAAQAGVVCLVCHSIDATTPAGNGAYHVRFATVPAPGAGHGARLRPPLLSTSELCASCHKVALTEEVTHDRWLRGQNDYDPWQSSAAAGNGVGAVPRPSLRARCQECHMPLEPARLGDAAAKNGLVRSHRFVAANTALPSLRGDEEQLERTRQRLLGTVSVELAWVEPDAANQDGERLVDVVLRSRGVGHRFPGGTMDSNEAWIALEALAADGGVLGRSGALDGAGALDPEAHLIRAQAVDGDGQPIARRDPQHARGIAWDTSLSPSDPSVVRYALPRGTERVRARVLYRKLSAAYTRYACATVAPALRARCEAVPVVEIARAELSPSSPPPTWMALVDHALGLCDAVAERAASALPLVAAARAQAPGHAEPELALARVALALGQTDEAVAATERAAAIAPASGAALWLRATGLWRAYRVAAARPVVERLAAMFPSDRNVLGLLARVRGSDGDAGAALEAAERMIAIDPESADGHYQRALALRALGRGDEARAAEARYVRFRADSERDLDLRAKYDASHPGRANESWAGHVHRVRVVE